MRRTRRPGFSEEVLRAYAYACAFCGYDGMLGRHPVTPSARRLEAAHVRWHSQDGPDTLANALALCALHHILCGLGVLGLSPGLRIQVSPLYAARSHAGHAIDILHRQPLAPPRPAPPTPAPAPARSTSAGITGRSSSTPPRRWRGERAPGSLTRCQISGLSRLPRRQRRLRPCRSPAPLLRPATGSRWFGPAGGGF